MSDPYTLPFYVCLDASVSMEGSRIDSFNKALGEIHKLIASDPIVASRFPIGVISVSNSAEVLLPLSILTDVVEIPCLVAKEGTSYGNAFTCLKQTIQNDIGSLRMQRNILIIRPMVLFVSGSAPTDHGWRAAHAAIADKNWPFSPHIIAIGVGEAQTEFILEVATKFGRSETKFAYFADDNADPGAVLIEIFRLIIYSMIGARTTPWEMPVTGPGFIKLNE